MAPENPCATCGVLVRFALNVLSAMGKHGALIREGILRQREPDSVERSIAALASLTQEEKARHFEQVQAEMREALADAECEFDDSWMREG